jgi:hypothetical protein
MGPTPSQTHLGREESPSRTPPLGQIGRGGKSLGGTLIPSLLGWKEVRSPRRSPNSSLSRFGEGAGRHNLAAFKRRGRGTLEHTCSHRA